MVQFTPPRKTKKFSETIQTICIEISKIYQFLSRILEFGNFWSTNLWNGVFKKSNSKDCILVFHQMAGTKNIRALLVINL